MTEHPANFSPITIVSAKIEAAATPPEWRLGNDSETVTLRGAFKTHEEIETGLYIASIPVAPIQAHHLFTGSGPSLTTSFTTAPFILTIEEGEAGAIAKLFAGTGLAVNHFILLDGLFYLAPATNRGEP